MNSLINDVRAWESAPWRPNGRHEDAILPSPTGAVFSELQQAASGRLLSGEDTLFDALGTLTPGQDAYASYVDNFGGFPTLLTMRNRLNPNAIYFSYTIFGNPANCADVEPGAMHPDSAARWLHDGRARVLPGNSVPLVYTSAGNADSVFAACGENIPHSQLPSSFIYQSAHYSVGPHICGPGTCGYRQAHGTQWADTGPGGQNFDRALWLPGVLGGSAPPPPLPPLPQGADPSMVSIAMSSDGDIVALCETQPSGPGKTGEVFALRTTGAWNGADGVPWQGVQGKTSHLWESLGVPKP